MPALTIGPLAFAWDSLAVVAAVATMFVAARFAAAHRRPGIERALAWSLAGALFGGRLTYVLLHAGAYLASPFDVLAIWDGGITWVAGAVMALIIATELTRRYALPARAVLAPLLAGAAVWLLFGGVQAWHDATQPARWPDAVLASVHGEPVRLADFRGRPVVVNQWATWCGPCRREMPLLAAAQRRRTDVTFLFVDAGEPAPVVARFLAAESLALENVLLDPGGAFQAFGAGVLPTTLFFDARGRLVTRHVGALSAARLESMLDSLR